MPKMVHGADVTSMEMNGFEEVVVSPHGYFAYDATRDEYGVRTEHRVAPELARMVLAGSADYDRLPDDAVGKRVGGLLIPLLATGNSEVVGVSTTSPSRLQASLHAYTRLPDLSITDRELAHLARADFEALWADMDGPETVAAA